MMDIRSLSSLSTGRSRKNLFRYQGSKVKCAWFRQTSQLAPKEVAKQRDDGIQSEPLRDHLDVTHPTLSLRSAGPHGRAKTAAKFLAPRFPAESPYCFSQTVSLVKGLPSTGLVPFAKMLRTLPSFETENVAVSACLPSLVKFASTLLALIRLVETVCAVIFDGVSVRHRLSGRVDALDADFPGGIPRSRLTLWRWTRIKLRFCNVELPGPHKWITLRQQQPCSSECEEQDRKNCTQSFHVMPSSGAFLSDLVERAMVCGRLRRLARGRQVVFRLPSRPHYLMAIGFTGDPTALVMGSGGAQKKNSYTWSLAESAARSFR